MVFHSDRNSSKAQYVCKLSTQTQLNVNTSAGIKSCVLLFI